MPGEEAQSHSLVEYDFCLGFEKEELEGSILILGRTSFDVIILTQLPTKMHLVEQAQGYPIKN